jgi:hypothetical protein
VLVGVLACSVPLSGFEPLERTVARGVAMGALGGTAVPWSILMLLSTGGCQAWLLAQPDSTPARNFTDPAIPPARCNECRSTTTMAGACVRSSCALAVVSAGRLATHLHRDCEVAHQVRAKRGPVAGSVVARRRSRNDGLRCNLAAVDIHPHACLTSLIPMLRCRRCGGHRPLPIAAITFPPVAAAA